PHKRRQFARDRRDGELWRLAPREQTSIACMQPMLGAPRYADRGGRRPALTDAQAMTDRRPMATMPRRFDQHPAEVRVAGLGDPAALLRCAAGIFRRHEAGEA